MDPACLQHQVTEQERTTFERDGYLIVENAIPQSLVDRLVPISDRVDRQERDRMGKSPEDGRQREASLLPGKQQPEY
ncbi:uncharacterized protein METZ01_LOCUS387045, partial [marine metagenome]